MITEIKSDKLVVISDLHLGNPFCGSSHAVLEFLEYIFAEGYDLVINGDGLEIAQASFQKIARDVPDVFRALKNYSSKATSQTFYVVGNHDIALEHFLEDWGSIKVVPFLNVNSGDTRARIEHGHLYDPMFVKHPNLYEFLTWLAGFFLKVSPSIYKLWIAYESFLSRANPAYRLAGGIPGEHPNFIEAAQMLARRGFDLVIFGHTHHAGQVGLERGRQYFNSGSFMVQSSFLTVENGTCLLRKWEGKPKGHLMSGPSTNESLKPVESVA